MRGGIRLAALLAFVVALSSCSIFDYSNVVVHRYALVYGVSAYTMNASGPNLNYPHQDAASMAALLAAQGYTVTSRWVDKNGVVWTTGGVSHGLIGSPATNTTDGSVNSGTSGPGEAYAPSKSNILADIKALSGTLGSDDLLVVYFSGHGTQDTSSSPSREYFDPYGSVMQYTDGQFYDFPVPSVRDDELRSAFNAFKTPRKVLILDTCNSGGFIGNRLEVDAMGPAYTGAPPIVSPLTLIQAIANYASMSSSETGLSPYGAEVLSAAGADESSYETSQWQHGVMTYWLLQGLQGSEADLNKDGSVTVLEAFSYTKAGIEKNWNTDSSKAFEPHVSGGPVDFVLF